MERGGYRTIAHVHDELITEIPEGTGDLIEAEKLMCKLPKWAAGFPVSADGFIAKRYRKD